MKRYHCRRTTRWGVTAQSPTMVTFHDTRFVKCQWWNDCWTVKTVVTWRSSASMIPAPGRSTAKAGIKPRSGGRNSSVGSVWARCPQRRVFDPPLGAFSIRGDFSLGVNMGSNSIPPKTLLEESINQGLVCAHMHFIARTQKILTFMS